jgi:geranylgeranyl pyrophosphate synthase
MLQAFLQSVVAATDRVLDTLFVDSWPSSLGEASRYPLSTGGKRVRPALCLAMHDALNGSGEWSETLLAVAVSVELIHSYSLVHDDLPCLDDDDTRRGHPSVHKKFGVGPALLVGDVLLTEAFALLARQELSAEIRIALVADLAQAAGIRGMIGGQAADIGMGGPITNLPDLLRLHALKTGALLQICAVMGARVANASTDQLALVKAYGTTVGLAFQMADDMLDAEEDAGVDGPPSIVKFLGVDETQRRTQQLADEAVSIAQKLPHPQRLVELAQFIVNRDH